ncbi:ferredoxin [Rhodococcus sp. 06-418-5]|uniref:ferredoxin n=1 Tax=Rhodococcus sp. 06-418-5 TaxID=2022507 RepID=UPI000B9B0640|nr:ferredoxin [Rhodococcus sp. 06-418-5]OZC79070.1 ferredoxin [Rhodococcus sp. 06-418-5]
MKISVDLALCQDYGQCVYAAPTVFTLNDTGLEFESNPSEDDRTDVEAAVDACPLQAISIVGS